MSLIVIDDDSSDELETLSQAGPSRVTEHGRNSTQSVQEAQSAPSTSLDGAETIDTANNSNDDEDKPLLALVKRLQNYNGKQNTKITNNQLVDILKNEFDLDLTKLQLITVDIYMKVLKKFLKDWPRWDEFDKVMHETLCTKDNDEVEKMREIVYNSLKEYLAAILKATKPIAEGAVQKLKRSLEMTPSPSSSKAVPGDVVLEINCTRDQLNTLFFRKPHPKHKGTIFNVDNSLPSLDVLTLNSTSFQSMLNSCYVSITIKMACFEYKRECLHNFKHTLVNKKKRQRERDPPVNTHLQVCTNIKTAQLETTKKDLQLVLETTQPQLSNSYGTEQQHDVDTIFETVTEDINVLPESKIEVPCTYRCNMSKYPYIRYLYKDVETDSEKYDLQLKEKITPMLRFHIAKLSHLPRAVTADIDWIELECTICQVKYRGVQGIQGLKRHFRKEHQNEPDWACSHCDQVFGAAELAAARWRHQCKVGEHSSQ